MNAKNIITVAAITLLMPVSAFSEIDRAQVQRVAGVVQKIAFAYDDHVLPNTPNEITGALVTGGLAILLHFLRIRNVKKKSRR